MTYPQLVAVGANLAILGVTTVVFGEWATQRLGHLDPDHIGLSMQAWAPLVLAATVAATFGVAWRSARTTAGVLVLVLVAVVLDQLAGALRDGHVSPAGVATGVLMALQCLTLAATVAMPAAPRRLASVGTVAVAVLAVFAVAVASGAAVRSSGEAPHRDAVTAWLLALQNDEDDRGWRYLDELTRSRTPRPAYVTDAAEVDWSSFEWRIGHVGEVDGFWSAHIDVDGGLEAVPRFFFEHRLAYPVCVDNRGTGIGVWVDVPLLGHATVGSGALTGSAERGECPSPDAERPHVDPVSWGDEPAWTGFELEVWNRTTLDLFMVDDSGRQVALPACEHVSTNDLDAAQTVEVRAADGYVFAFGTGGTMELTKFVVVLPGESSMNGAPPIERLLPACEGEPQVQPGV